MMFLYAGIAALSVVSAYRGWRAQLPDWQLYLVAGMCSALMVFMVSHARMDNIFPDTEPAPAEQTKEPLQPWDVILDGDTGARVEPVSPELATG